MIHPRTASPRLRALVIVAVSAVSCDSQPLRHPTVVDVVDRMRVVDGSSLAAPFEPLADIRVGAALDDSTIAVFDAITSRLTIASRARGAFSQFGERGDGPSEFRSVAGIGSHGRNEILAYDQRLKRITAFDAKGRVLYSHRTTTPGQLAGRTFSILSDGRYVIRSLRRGASGGAEIYYEILAPDGSQLQQVGLPDDPDWGLPVLLEFPFEPHVVSTIGRGGDLMLARTDRYEILVQGAHGIDTIRGVREPVSVLPDERANYQAWADFITQQTQGGVTRDVPTVKPVIRALWTASDGSLVVELHGRGIKRTFVPERSRLGPEVPQLEWTEEREFDLFTSRGERLGRLTLPQQTRLLDVYLPSLWVEVLDSLDVPSIEVWTLATPDE